MFNRAILYFRKSSRIEAAATAIAIIEPASDIPQIIQLYSTKSAEDFNIISWYLGVGFSVIWLIYAIREKSIPVLVSAIGWLIVETILLFGIISYR